MSIHVVFATVPPDRADALARTLVQEGHCACINVIPTVRSHYIWQGKQEEDTEALLIIKVSADRVAALTARLRELHPYSVPEILVLPVTGGNPDYLAWVERGGG